VKLSHDILIIGAGPAGSTAAQRLAARGYDAAVVEEHAVIGEPVDCTGVLGSEAFERFDLPRETILGSIEAITIHSPIGVTITHHNGEPFAHVVDRAELDRNLARRALEAGATFHLNTQAVEVTPHAAGVDVNCRFPDGEMRRLSAKLLFLAGGPRFAFQERLGMGTCPVLWRSAHTELPGNGLPNPQVYLGRQVAPGAFAWAVPARRAGAPFVRIGINSHADAPQYLRRLCEERFSHLLSADRPLEARSWVVPIVPLSRTYAERVLAIGDAAGQVKPTSGGGIYFGMLSAELAAETATEALRQGKFGRESLAGYEKRWRACLGLDIKIGTLFRRLFSRMTDHDVDHLFRTLRRGNLLSHLEGKVSFDWHRELILFLLRHPALARLFLRRCWDRNAEPPFSDVPALGD
jgi:digeranylgeranylglycerophospholipid reductase